MSKIDKFVDRSMTTVLLECVENRQISLVDWSMSLYVINTHVIRCLLEIARKAKMRLASNFVIAPSGKVIIRLHRTNLF